jgi:hypothetical protein
VDLADANRLELLDRITQRVPDLDLGKHSVEWMTLSTTARRRCSVDGGGIDGGPGAYSADAGDDVDVVGSLSPLVEGWLGCIVIRPDGTRVLAHVELDPLAEASE